MLSQQSTIGDQGRFPCPVSSPKLVHNIKALWPLVSDALLIPELTASSLGCSPRFWNQRWMAPSPLNNAPGLPTPLVITYGHLNCPNMTLSLLMLPWPSHLSQCCMWSTTWSSYSSCEMAQPFCLSCCYPGSSNSPHRTLVLTPLVITPSPQHHLSSSQATDVLPHVP